MKTIHMKTTINASIVKVWQTITTKEGIASYMSPEVNVTAHIGGPYEIYFDPSMPKGEQGSEGMVVICNEPEKRFGFTWNNPPSLPEIRGQQTAAFYELAQLEDGTVELDFYHIGFGESEQWAVAYGYFVKSWGQIVLPRLIYACETGAYPWEEERDLADQIKRVIQL